MNLRIFIKPLLALLPVLIGGIDASARQADSTKYTHRVGVNVRPSHIMPTHRFFRGENELGRRLSASGSAHLQYSFSFPQISRFGKTYPTAYQGIGLAWNTFFDQKEIGSPATVYVFQGARLASIAPRVSLDYEWNFGVSFGWRPYDPDGEILGYENSKNLVVGSRVNAYINFGLLLSWQPFDNWTLSAGADLTHFSNGNTIYPNAGVNTIGGRVGVTRSFGPSGHLLTSKAKRSSDCSFTDGTRPASRMTYDILLYGAGRTKGLIWHDSPYIAEGSFGILGLNVSPLYRVNKFFRAGASLDVQYDESANVIDHVAGTDEDGNIRFYRPPLNEQLGIGVSLRAEFVMPVFSVNIGFGRNVIYKGDELKGFYQTLALKTDIHKGLYLHIGYKLHDFHDPNNLMLGLGWRFGNR